MLRGFGARRGHKPQRVAGFGAVPRQVGTERAFGEMASITGRAAASTSFAGRGAARGIRRLRQRAGHLSRPRVQPARKNPESEHRSPPR